MTESVNAPDLAGPLGPVPRIAPGTPAQLGLINTLIAKVTGRMTGGPPPHIFTTLARNRRLFKQWMVFAGGLMPYGRLPRVDSELVILRVAHNTSCDYEWHHHEKIGQEIGLSAEEVARVRQGPAADGWTGRQHALLSACDDLSERGVVSDDAWAALAQFYDESELIEFLLLAGHYHMLSMTLKSLNIQPDPPH